MPQTFAYLHDRNRTKSITKSPGLKSVQTSQDMQISLFSDQQVPRPIQENIVLEEKIPE